MRHLGLFEGIGGFSLAARWMGWETVAWVEINEFCQQVLKKNFPEAKGYGDIKQFDGTKYSGAVDILTGGFPCQPFSVAGKQKGKDDPRYLWPEMLRIIGEVRPKFVVGENVSGSWKLVNQIRNDMANEGYEVQPINITACAVGADHVRSRYWFIAYPAGRGSQEGLPLGMEKEYPAHGNIFEEETWYTSQYEREIESMLGGAYNGIPNRVDRIKALGNAIVPQVAYEIFKAINLTIDEVSTPPH